MPENNTGIITDILKYGWLALLGMGTWIWKSLASQVDTNAKALSDHVSSHSEFVTHTYMQDEIKPWLNRIDNKMDMLVTQTADIIKREEYKKDVSAIHDRLNGLQSKVDQLR
jgi:hypothetical protein